MHHRRVVLVVLAAAAIIFPTGVAHAARQPTTLTVEARDDCDPATFAADPAQVPCNRTQAGVPFDKFVATVQKRGSHPAWKFANDHATIHSGDSLLVKINGGGFHSFSEVQNFGGGCVPFFDQLTGLTPVPECSDILGNFILKAVTPGFQPQLAVPASALPVGTHKFQCLAHPWMHFDLTVLAG
jgi:hypothetical protein